MGTCDNTGEAKSKSKEHHMWTSPFKLVDFVLSPLPWQRTTYLLKATFSLSFRRCLCCCLKCFQMLLLFSVLDNPAQRVSATFQERLELVGHRHLFCQDVRQHMSRRHPLHLYHCALYKSLSWSPADRSWFPADAQKRHLTSVAVSWRSAAFAKAAESAASILSITLWMTVLFNSTIVQMLAPCSRPRVVIGGRNPP